MADFSLTIKEFVEDFNLDSRQIIIVSIINNTSKFEHYSEPPFVTISDGNTSVDSFLAPISDNKQEFLGFFTSDALMGLSGNVTVSFGYGFDPVHEFPDINLSTTIQPLDPLLALLGAPLGDSVWLTTIL